MDSMIPLGQKNTLAEYKILSGADNRPPMLDKDLIHRKFKLHRIQETRPLFKMAGSQCNKFKDKFRVILVLGIRVMLLVLGETLQVDRHGLLNAITIKVKDIWLGNVLSLSDREMQHDLGVLDGQAVQKIILNNAAFQTGDLDTYDSDYDDISDAKAVLMANISNYGSDVISEGMCGGEWWREAGSHGLWWEGRRVREVGVKEMTGNREIQEQWVG
uniref:Uncharacterized protein n=1 Tax=Tanacetum cinerariifolium TaxID=118510 RepID=A0A6L2JG44_TANCI|nr:hypothetical protein [Tanacetum cinerariifolium]